MSPGFIAILLFKGAIIMLVLITLLSQKKRRP